MFVKKAQITSPAAQEGALAGAKAIDTKPSRPLRAWSIKLLFIISCCCMLVPSFGGTAFAYTRGNAVNYADRWALSRNSASYPSWSVDCTDFVSQALVAGGYPQYGTNSSVTDDHYWWGYWLLWDFNHSHSWAVAPDHYNFQMWHYPGGWLEAVVNSSDSAYWGAYDNVNMIGGDVLFFDWGKGEGMSHAAFQVWPGYSQYTSNWYGDLSDQHTTDRYHVSWSHIEVNADWPTTTIYEVHIDDRN